MNCAGWQQNNACLTHTQIQYKRIILSGKNNLVLYTPLVLLILFLFGYIGIALIGRPNMLMACILLGGSIFVMIILNILYYIVGKVAENERLEQELNQALPI